MKRGIFILIIIFSLFVISCIKQEVEQPIVEQTTGSEKVEGEKMENVEWLGHASIKLTGEKIIYIDPWKIKGDEKADIILITHEHYDHCSAEDIVKILKNDTAIITVADCQSKLMKLNRPISLVEPGKKLNVKGVVIETVPAYNINKSFHPKENGWVGYIINMNSKRYYHAGDTDFIPEMASLRNIDVAFLPIGGTYTMDVKEAAKAANTIKAKITAPMHFGDIVGSRSDAEKFKGLVQGRVEILG